jgi:ATP-dependent helicase HrpB
VTEAEIVEWAVDGGFTAVHRATLGAITLREAQVKSPDPEQVTAAIVAMVRAEGVQVLPWNDGAVRLRARLALLYRLAAAGTIQGEWPDVSDEGLLARLESWLAPGVRGIRRRADLARLDLHDLLLNLLPWDQRRALDRLAPTHIEVPSGSRIGVDYSHAAGPVLPVRLQEVFGLEDTPRVADGKVPVILHLLSPAFRPVQVTQDLAGFWRTSYFDVRKEMKGRYPKHNWPEDPLTEPASRRTRK